MPTTALPRLRWAPLVPTLLALATVVGLGGALLPGRLARSTAKDLATTLPLVLPSIPPPVAPYVEARRAVRRLAAETPYRLSLILADGTVVADSERSDESIATMENHAGRPEIVAALARGAGTDVRLSATTGVETAYAARWVAAPGGGFVVRLAEPLVALGKLRRSLASILALATAVALAAALVLALWIRRALLAPLEGLIGTAERLGRGELDVAIAAPTSPDLEPFARALERIAAAARRQLAAAEAERDHLRATVASMTEGVLVTDRRGRVRLINPAFRALFGSPEVSEGLAVLEVARLPELADLIDRALSGEIPASDAKSVRIDLDAPRPRTVALTATALAGDAGGALVVVRDVSEAERLSEMRRDFVANVSHELKTPLAAIRGYAETLADGAAGDSATALRFSERILGQCRRLGALLDDLLTLSRLESDLAPAAIAPVDLAEVAAEARDLLAESAAARQVEVAVEAAPGARVTGDANALFRAVANLLDNAIKYNRPGGSATVRVSTVGAEAVIEVADTGIGIPTPALPRLFERFFRVDKGRSRDEGGTGLGLAIVKHAAQAHGGRVEVESELGRGTTFRLRLPRISD